jgi:hypothetical protein
MADGARKVTENFTAGFLDGKREVSVDGPQAARAVAVLVGV